MYLDRKIISLVALGAAASTSCLAFTTSNAAPRTTTALNGLFDNWGAGGSGKDRLDEEWEKQQEILKFRKSSTENKQKYFEDIERKRIEASKKQTDNWGWQTKTYKKGEDPIDEWKKRREQGVISDLENQYGDPKKIGGIPLPGASFGVGGEFGVGGKFDNGGRFDLRLPYADQGYVDEDADVMGKIGNFFSGGKKKKEEEPVAPPPPEKKATSGLGKNEFENEEWAYK
eukprot:CAMPEP_0203702380 /NCGR_PEP_ID=MMETSP0091-20130426/39163_1 /ASSEMBLY_ACC=CAM_ASM_001089 /TAXON_ID=426623 /ORGANISM="Chaetoceros affinis, Strain CCMP159" /LENGTH=228 /DNA_ID=CAMNT_0050576503 /DNA_START=6 /DNA_END=693 /DNA_ORIENTATION=+